MAFLRSGAWRVAIVVGTVLIGFGLVSVREGALAVLAGSASARANGPSACYRVCTYTGGPQQWVVPTGVLSATFDVYGAQGGLHGGRGAQVRATLRVFPGQRFVIYVGGMPARRNSRGGYNGGGAGGSPGAGGGGASDVRIGPGYGLDDRVLVAGGGGGSAPSSIGGRGGASSTPGTAGSVSGCCDYGNPGAGGGAGTRRGGGAGGGGGNPWVYENPGWTITGVPGATAALGVGGVGSGGGGGGGGLYGGGGGGLGTSCSNEVCGEQYGGSGGGGGGSSFGSAQTTNGVRPGNGEVVIMPHHFAGIYCTALTGNIYGQTLTGCPVSSTGGSGTGGVLPGNASIAWANHTTTSFGFKASTFFPGGPALYRSRFVCSLGGTANPAAGAVTASTNQAIPVGTPVTLDICSGYNTFSLESNTVIAFATGSQHRAGG